MYCFQCGTQIADEAQFCSGCGRTVAGSPVQQIPRRSMATHVNILAWLFIGTGILYAMVGFSLLIVPHFLRILPMPPDLPFGIFRFISSIASLLGIVVIAVAGGTAAAGVGLLQYQTWGRTLALVMSAINL